MFVDEIDKIIDEMGVDVNLFWFEIIESVVMENLRVVCEMLVKFKVWGF